MTDATPYIVPKEPGLGRSLALAALVHAALLAFLWIGVQWQSATPVAIEAEVWSLQPREAAPLPEPATAPEPEPQPQPQPKPVIQEPPKPKVVEPPPVEKPDIALEQEKKRKAQEEKKRLEEERLAKEKKRREEEEKLANEKKRLEEEKLAKLELEKKKQLEKEKAEKEKAEKARKEAEEKKRKQEEEMLAKMREQEMWRVTGGVTGTGGAGEAPKTQGGRASSDYSAKIGAKIRSNITFAVPEGLQGNPPVEYEVRLLPDGSLAGMRKIRSSGVPGFDEAVARAIERSQPFPRDTNGTVPSSFFGIHKPKD